MVHAIGSGVNDVSVKPAQGYREETTKGAVVGLVKGLGGLIISPLAGAMIFTDYLTTGAYNNGREKNEKKRGSRIKGNNKFLDVMGFRSRKVYSSSMSADEVVDDNSRLSRQIAIQLTPEDDSTLEGRFHTLKKKHGRYDEVRFKLTESLATVFRWNQYRY